MCSSYFIICLSISLSAQLFVLLEVSLLLSAVFSSVIDICSCVNPLSLLFFTHPGEIPASLGLLSNLTVLNMHDSKFTGKPSIQLVHLDG